MTIEEKESTLREFERVKELLDGIGVEYEIEKPSFIAFDNKSGDCLVFPSHDHDDKLVISYRIIEWCDTAEDVLKACGLLKEQ